MGRSRGGLRTFSTTLLELVRGLSEALPEDGGVTAAVSELIRRGWLRTPDGLVLVLSHDDEPPPAPARRPLWS